jgi:hypothetical protein
MKITTFWDIEPCNIVEADRRFRGAYCLDHQDDKKQYPLNHQSPSTRLHDAMSESCNLQVSVLEECALYHN